ncbi:low specificity L-threonine aldolase, partial [bacterium]
SQGGAMDPDLVARRITRENLHTPGTSLVCLENTHNRAGGAVLPLATMRATRQVADAAGVPVHLDGARVMNAVAAGGGTLMEISAEVDSLTICLSKGLGAPAGTVLCGPADLVDRALRIRKRLGGGMRQIGFLCAAGAFALEHQATRLTEDHARAQRLAQALTGTEGITVTYPGTNMVLLTTEGPAARWQEALESEGVRCLAAASDRLRLVTHHDVDDAGIERTIAAVQTVAGILRGSPRAAALSSA